jgi:2-methylcitrate dehydratase PrpD
LATAAETFAEWGLSLRAGDLPDDVRDAAALHLMDGLGVAIAAHRLRAAPYAIDTAAAFASPEEATVIGDGRRLPAPAAALANGALVHALDYDDTHAAALVHATAAVLPAAFAAGEAAGASGADVLAACVAGYETVIRLGAAVRHGFHARGFHATAVCGVFASALMASKLMGLSHAQTVNAMGIAGSRAAGSLQFLHTGSCTKQLHPGFAAFDGIVAARLAGTGASGPASILEGEYGLYRAYTATDVDAAALTKGLGETWETPAIEFKLLPICHLSHATIYALRQLGLHRSRVDEVVARVPDEIVPIVCEPAEHKRRPRSPYEAKFSLAYCVAAVLSHGDATLECFEESRLHDPALLAAADRFRYEPYSSAVPAQDAPGDVTVRMRDGGTVHGRWDGFDSGDLDDLAIRKFMQTSQSTNSLRSAILTVDNAANVADILALTAL